MHCNTQCSSSGSLVFTHLGCMREKTMQLYMYMTLYYNYISLLLQYHKLYINTHLSVLFAYSSQLYTDPLLSLFLTYSSSLICTLSFWCLSAPSLSLTGNILYLVTL